MRLLGSPQTDTGTSIHGRRLTSMPHLCSSSASSSAVHTWSSCLSWPHAATSEARAATSSGRPHRIVGKIPGESVTDRHDKSSDRSRRGEATLVERLPGEGGRGSAADSKSSWNQESLVLDRRGETSTYVGLPRLPGLCTCRPGLRIAWWALITHQSTIAHHSSDYVLLSRARPLSPK